MRFYRANDGTRRIWYDVAEIEAMAERCLHSLDRSRELSTEAIDLEYVIERHLNCLFEPYADLAPDVLGVTEFAIGKRPRIRVNKTLTEAYDAAYTGVSRRGRWRATLAHEIGHVLLHRCLYDPSPNALELDLGQTGATNRIACSHLNDRRGGSRFDWREVQANMCMAALLMPRREFASAMEKQASQLRCALPLTGAEDDVVVSLAHRFDVSRQAARIRVQTISSPSAQLGLLS